MIISTLTIKSILQEIYEAAKKEDTTDLELLLNNAYQDKPLFIEILSTIIELTESVPVVINTRFITVFKKILQDKFAGIPAEETATVEISDWKIWLRLINLAGNQPSNIKTLVQNIISKTEPELACEVLYYLHECINHFFTQLPKVVEKALTASTELKTKFSPYIIYAQLLLINNFFYQNKLTRPKFDKNLSDFDALIPTVLNNIQTGHTILQEQLKNNIQIIFEQIILTNNIKFLTIKQLLDYLSYITHLSFLTNRMLLIDALLERIKLKHADLDVILLEKIILDSACFFGFVTDVQIVEFIRSDILIIQNRESSQNDHFLRKFLFDKYVLHKNSELDYAKEAEKIKQLMSASPMWQIVMPYILLLSINQILLNKELSVAIDNFFSIFSILQEKPEIVITKITLYFLVDKFAEAETRFTADHQKYFLNSIQRYAASHFWFPNDKAKNRCAAITFSLSKLQVNNREINMLALDYLINVLLELVEVSAHETCDNLKAFYQEIPAKIIENVIILAEEVQSGSPLAKLIREHCQKVFFELLQLILKRKKGNYVINTHDLLDVVLSLKYYLAISFDITLLENIVKDYFVFVESDRNHHRFLLALSSNYINNVVIDKLKNNDLITQLLKLNQPVVSNERDSAVKLLTELLLRVANNTLAEIDVHCINDVFKNEKIVSEDLDIVSQILQTFSMTCTAEKYNVHPNELQLLICSIEMYAHWSLGLQHLNAILVDTPNSFIKEISRIIKLVTQNVLSNEDIYLLRHYEKFILEFDSEKVLPLQKILLSMLYFVQAFLLPSQEQTKCLLFKKSIACHSSLALTFFSSLSARDKFIFLKNHGFYFLNENLQVFIADEFASVYKKVRKIIAKFSSENIWLLKLISDAILQLPLMTKEERIATFNSLHKSCSSYQNKNMIDLLIFFNVKYKMPHWDVRSIYNSNPDAEYTGSEVTATVNMFKTYGANSLEFVDVVMSYYLEEIASAAQAKIKNLSNQPTLLHFWKRDRDEPPDYPAKKFIQTQVLLTDTTANSSFSSAPSSTPQ